jgi:hypothetical protein
LQHHDAYPIQPNNDINNDEVNGLRNNMVITIFSTIAFLKEAFCINKIHMDGTFKTVPSSYYQLFTLHGYARNNAERSFPFIYIFCTHKSQAMYSIIFDWLRQKAAELNVPIRWQTVVTDFELSLLNALNISFPLVIRHGCFFHFCQCLFRKIQELGLSQIYNRNNINVNPQLYFKRYVRMLFALAFLPHNIIQDVFVNMLTNTDVNQYYTLALSIDVRVLNFNQYILNNWIGNQARFPQQLWNCRNEADRRTNNNVEGWHSHLLSECKNVMHVNLWKFITVLKDEQHRNEDDLQLLINGRQVNATKRKKYKNKESNIVRMLTTWNNNTYFADNDHGNIVGWLHTLSIYMNDHNFNN